MSTTPRMVVVFNYPEISNDLHYEVELGVVIGKTLSKVPASDVMSHVAGYAIAIDVTCRDIQEQCKAERTPWTMAKCLDTFCPIGPLVSPDKIDAGNTEITLKQNGVLKQHGNTADMIFSVPTLLEYVAAHITLLPGDVLLTGTPEGVGPLARGDVLEDPMLREVIVHEQRFMVPERYQDCSYLGHGSYGCVIKARDTQDGRDVAIKRLLEPFKRSVSAKRAYRELVLLAYCHHPSVSYISTSLVITFIFLVKILLQLDPDLLGCLGERVFPGISGSNTVHFLYQGRFILPVTCKSGP
eukprot:sb/3467447/